MYPGWGHGEDILPIFPPPQCSTEENLLFLPTIFSAFIQPPISVGFVCANARTRVYVCLSILKGGFRTEKNSLGFCVSVVNINIQFVKVKIQKSDFLSFYFKDFI